MSDWIGRVFCKSSASMEEIPDAAVDSLVTDPPAGIEFLGKEWDSFRGDIRQPDDAAFHRSGSGPHDRSTVRYGTSAGYKNGSARANFIDALRPIFTESLRVLKPGAHGIIWALPRTSHWTATALEDAGFEIRDVAVHLFGQGFPKSKNIAGGRGTALKPASEHWILVRKPLDGTVQSNFEKHGTGVINIDASRIGAETVGWRGGGTRSWNTKYAEGQARPASGRWPANVTLDEEAAKLLDEQSGIIESGEPAGDRNATIGYNGGGHVTELTGYGDRGGASRFFFVAKADGEERSFQSRVKHPTIKPIALMQYLVRMVTPPGGIVLEPFAGSGTTLEAAVSLGMRYVAYEQHEPYHELIAERLRQQGLFSA